MLQPIATILAALVVVSVTGYFGWHQREIAREQARIGREKLRLDLYDRRFEIFTSIFDFYDAIISWKGTPAQQDAYQRLFRAYHASGFLFKKESGIEALLKMLNGEGAKVIGFKENIDIYKSDPTAMSEQSNTIIQVVRVFDEALPKLRRAMHDYLDFSKL